jgi:hypothetical protein
MVRDLDPSSRLKRVAPCLIVFWLLVHHLVSLHRCELLDLRSVCLVGKDLALLQLVGHLLLVLTQS